MAKNSEDMLGKLAVARTTGFLADKLGSFAGAGRVIAYCDAPTVIIEKPDGSQFSWRADLCEFYDFDFGSVEERMKKVLESLK